MKHLLLLTGFLLVTVACAQQSPVVQNPGFEFDANNDGTPDFWNRYISNGTAQTSLDGGVKHGGEKSLWIDVSADSRCTISQLMPLGTTGEYTFGCWLKTDLAEGANAHLYMQWRKGGETISVSQRSPVLTATNDWTEISCVGTKPAEATHALLVIVVETLKAKASSVWADDAWLKPGAFPKGPAAPAAAPAAPTLPPGQFVNPSFEADADNNNQPDGWSIAIHGQGFEITRDPAVGHTGAASARLVGKPGAADRSAILQVSSPLPTPKAARVRVWVKGTGKADGILRYRPVPGVQVEGDQYGQQNFSIELPQANWTEVTFDMPTPAAVAGAAQVRLEVILYQRGEGTVWYDDVSVEPLAQYTPKQTKTEEALQMPWRPAVGRIVLQNPPDFSWPPQPAAARYELQLSQSPDFPTARTVSHQSEYNVYSHSQTLALGTWHWRTRFQDAGGQWSEWSDARPFEVTAAAVPFPVPPPDELLARIPQNHPRVYATAAGLAAFREPLQGKKKAWWEEFQRTLERYAQQPLAKEPPDEWRMGDRPGGGALTDADVQAGNKLRGYVDAANTRVQSLAFGYLLSGERKYADAAIAQMLEMATWNPLGVTSYKNQDQVFRDIAWMTATAYDWCWDVMTPEQRKTISEAILVRARTLYKDLAERGRPLHEAPYDSHGITAYGYLGIIAIALAHEYEEPDRWFKWIAATYPAVFPPWGGEEGGWSQGVGYWKWSTHFAWVFFDALKSATGLDLYQKAYSRNNGWYKLYMHPPWCDRHHFGDGNHGPPDSTDQSNLARYAAQYNNPYFQWYAANLPYRLGFGLYGYFWHDETIPVRPPADLPQGRYFPDIGWVAMHSDLSDPDDIMLMFKSSPYGSYNHSHADQNHFVLYGYGEPLLIDSGYYDWYGSPHDMGFTRQTKAHNAILVNGEGQPIMDMTAKGQILKHFTSPAVDYALGDATPAYKGKLSKWQRHIIYLRPDSFLILDDVEAPQASTFTWTLHAEQQMQLRPEKQEIMITRGNARCLVRFLTPQGLKLEQTDQFTPPSTRPLANEWHASATTTEKAKTMRFATFIRPAPITEPEADLEIQSQLQNDLLLLVWGTTPKPGGVISAWLGGKELNATVIGPWNDGAVATVIGGTSVTLKDPQGEFEIVKSNVPFDATLELKGKDNATAEVQNVYYQSSKPTPTSFLVREAVRQVTLDEKPLPASQYTCAKDKLTVQLPAGQHVLRVNPAAEAASLPPVRVLLDDQPLAQDLQTMRTYTGGMLTWGSFSAEPQPVRVWEVQAPPSTEVLVNNATPKPGQLVWLPAKASLNLRGSKPESLTVRYKTIVTNAQPVVVPTTAADVEKLPGAIKLEAEDYAAVGGGSFSRYTNRPFLSGGMGLGNWNLSGQWVQWKIRVPQAGKYRLYLKAATHESQALRLIQVDDKPLGGDLRTYAFPYTGGYGTTPAEWKVFELPETLELTAGEHTLYMMGLERLLNLDWVVVGKG